jgi:hypothetical protein
MSLLSTSSLLVKMAECCVLDVDFCQTAIIVHIVCRDDDCLSGLVPSLFRHSNSSYSRNKYFVIPVALLSEEGSETMLSLKYETEF